LERSLSLPTPVYLLDHLHHGGGHQVLPPLPPDHALPYLRPHVLPPVVEGRGPHLVSGLPEEPPHQGVARVDHGEGGGRRRGRGRPRGRCCSRRGWGRCAPWRPLSPPPPGPFQHEDPLPGREGVLQGVALLGATYPTISSSTSLRMRLKTCRWPQVGGLEAAYEKRPSLPSPSLSLPPFNSTLLSPPSRRGRRTCR